jgi:hypothetical protein
LSAADSDLMENYSDLYSNMQGILLVQLSKMTTQSVRNLQRVLTENTLRKC